MLSRVVIAAGFCLAACAPIAARAEPGDVPLVLGDAADAVESVIIAPVEETPAEGVPPEREPVTSVMVDAPSDVGDEIVPWTPGQVVSCIDEPACATAFTTVDVLFIERNNSVGPLAVENQATTDPGAPVISAGDVRYPVAPGLRVFQGWRGPDCRGYEVGYLGIWGMHADALATSPDGAIALPGQLGLIEDSGLDAATAIRPTLNANLNSAEFNVFSTHVYDGCRTHDPLPWRRSWGLLAGTAATADWILGIRWAGLDETATLDVTALAATNPSAYRTTSYRVTTTSQLVGPQIGHRRRVEWNDWAVEGWVKAAVVGSFLSQSQSSVVGPFDLVEIRGPRSSTASGVGMIGDVNATVVRRLGDHWGLRAGYTLLWLSGVAPAASQWDFSDTPTSGTRLVADTVFLHGATLGLEATW